MIPGFSRQWHVCVLRSAGPHSTSAWGIMREYGALPGLLVKPTTLPDCLNWPPGSESGPPKTDEVILEEMMTTYRVQGAF